MMRLRGEGEPARLVLGAVGARPLSPAHERVEGREQVERDQQRPALEELAVVDVAPGGQHVLELPGEPDARVVVRAARPAGRGPAHHRLPQTAQPIGEAVEGGAEPDRLDEARARSARSARGGAAAGGSCGAGAGAARPGACRSAELEAPAR